MTLTLLPRRRRREPPAPADDGAQVVEAATAITQEAQRDIDRRIRRGSKWLAEATDILRDVCYRQNVGGLDTSRLVNALQALAPVGPATEQTAQKWDALPGQVREVAVTMYWRNELCCAGGVNAFLRGIGQPELR